MWLRPGLAPWNRSIATVAALIARLQTVALPLHVALALDNSVTPAELSETITHLTFYSGRPNAMAAVLVAREVFAARRISGSELAPARPVLLPIDEAAEAKRAALVDTNAQPVSSGVEHYTTEAIFKDLWLRPDLKPRDRSLVTVCVLVAAGQVAPVPFHLNRAMDNGLMREEAAEVLTQLDLYSGWPNIFSAIPVFQGVFEARP